MRRAASQWVLGTLLVAGCGGAEQNAKVPIARETPKDQILRIARDWASQKDERGFRTPPSRIRMFTRRTDSRLSFDPGTDSAKEAITVDETFEVGDGVKYRCQTTFTTTVAARFGEHAGESAVEIRRGAVAVPRLCSADGFPEPTLELEASAARYALRGDRLVPFAPPTERREYIPAQ